VNIQIYEDEVMHYHVIGQSETPHVLALDLEGTLISNAISQIPRPGLFEFLCGCNELFPRMVAFTTVAENRFRNIAHILVKERLAPQWFADIEYINWEGKTKDLNYISNIQSHNALLVDDCEQYVHPGQERQWLKIEQFDYKNPSKDTELARIFNELRAIVHKKNFI